jgi:hypothetical protein
VFEREVNLKYPLVLTWMLRFKPTSRFAEWYHSVVSCALNLEDVVGFEVYSGGFEEYNLLGCDAV